ncbi:MAG: 8-amino-7-oxononanoate synthase [Rhodocyclaceae bacterium]|nr:8-amino-7-oxononanoate synthase [Rhodocyclaceae bacterium]
MDNSLNSELLAQLDALDARNRRRSLRVLTADQGRLVGVDGRRLIDVSSNDYLGLSQHPLTKSRAADWAGRYGAGAPSSRLVTGTRGIALELEERLAAFKGCEAALLIGSGFQANTTVIPALATLGDTLIFSDSLNHSSIVHGCRLAKARTMIFRHNDLDHLDELLRASAAHRGRRLIVTESVFSMDGDRCDLAALIKLAEQHGAALYVDEAHAVGVIGPQGRGLVAELPATSGKVDVVMGTLGKAFGAYGAYIAGSRALIDFLVNRCAGFIYATALPPAVLGAVDAALDLIPAMDAERTRLAANAAKLRHALNASGLDTLQSATQIVPAIIGTEMAALAAASRLNDAGILAVAIRPPTVAEGTSRLRFSLNSALTDADMDELLAAVGTLA